MSGSRGPLVATPPQHAPPVSGGSTLNVPVPRWPPSARPAVTTGRLAESAEQRGVTDTKRASPRGDHDPTAAAPPSTHARHMRRRRIQRAPGARDVWRPSPCTSKRSERASAQEKSHLV